MINVFVHFINDEGNDVYIDTELPALPRRGDSFHFVDSDRGVNLYVKVAYILWEEIDGELKITIEVC